MVKSIIRLEHGTNGWQREYATVKTAVDSMSVVASVARTSSENSWCFSPKSNHLAS